MGEANNSENLRLMQTKMKIFPHRLSPFSCSKSGEDQKKSSLKFSPVFGPKLGEGLNKRSSPTVCELKPFAQVTRGGGPCRNFAYYSMLITLSWLPKGGSWHHALPKYAPVPDMTHKKYLENDNLF